MNFEIKSMFNETTHIPFRKGLSALSYSIGNSISLYNVAPEVTLNAIDDVVDSSTENATSGSLIDIVRELTNNI